MGLGEYKGVHTHAQQTDDQLNRIGLELLGKARELAEALNTNVMAALIGSEVRELAEQLAEYGADRAIIVDNPALREYMTEPYAQALAGVIEAYKPEIMLVGAISIGRDLGPRVFTRVAIGLTADCTGLEIGDFPLNPAAGREQKHNQPLMTRPASGGNTITIIACPSHRPQMATVRPGVMQVIASVKGVEAEIIEYGPGIIPNHNYVEIMDIVRKAVETKDIMNARILVSGGCGIGGSENSRIPEELASAPDEQVNCSRIVVDAGWKPKGLQVGQTGKTVRPGLYVAVGIFGAIQYMAGMEESDVVITINKDENASIFEVADYGVAGDWKKIAPELIRQIQL